MIRRVSSLLIMLLLPGVMLRSQAATVAEYAFTGDMAVTRVSLDGGVTAIGEGAYAGTGVVTAIIPQGVTEIGAFAFADCRLLVKSEIPEGFYVLRAFLFRGCTALREVSLPSTIERVEGGVFAATALVDVDLSRCRALRSIGERCFAGCEALGSVKLPEGVTSIGNSAFFGCTALKEIIYPESLRRIGDCALACTSGISVMSLPPSLGYIGSNAMEGMNSLSGIDATWLNAVPQLGDDVWYGLPQPDIWLSVSPQLRDGFLASPQWSDFNISGGTVSTSFPVIADRSVKSVAVYRVSEIEIIVTTFNDGSRRVDKILKTK